MKELREYYQDFIISSFGKIEMTKLSKITDKTHDTFTKRLLLEKKLDDNKTLWKEVKPLLRDYENERDGCIIVDDTLLAKPYTKENEIVCWHYDHVVQRSKKGILMLNFHYTDESGISIPLGYELITKTKKEWNEKYQKEIRKSEISKNQLMREKLELLQNTNQVKYKYVLFDKWFGSMENLKFIDETLNKKFICPIKKNRRICFKEDINDKKYVNISSVDIESDSSRLIYLKGYEKPLRLIKLVGKNGNDGETSYLYLITNDIALSFSQILKIYQRRWKIEEYHKSLKQNLKIEHSPTKVELSQRNHIHLVVSSFIKLEKLRLNHHLNQFQIKEKIYIEALKSAYQKFQELSVA
jgi:hypothetical protein